MRSIEFHKVLKMPCSLLPNSLYFVKSFPVINMHLTDSSGEDTNVPLTSVIDINNKILLLQIEEGKYCFESYIKFSGRRKRVDLNFENSSWSYVTKTYGHNWFYSIFYPNKPRITMITGSCEVNKNGSIKLEIYGTLLKGSYFKILKYGGN